MKKTPSAFWVKWSFLGFWILLTLGVYSSKISHPLLLFASAFQSPFAGTSSLVPMFQGGFHIVFDSLCALLVTVSIWRIGCRIAGMFQVPFGAGFLELPFQYGLGVIGMTQLWLGLGLIGLWFRGPMIAILILVILWSLWDMAQDRKKLGALMRSNFLNPPWSYGVLLIFGFFYVLFSFLHGLGPETWDDSLVYHLGFLQTWLSDHRIGDMPTNSLIGFPFAGELYFLTGLILGDSEIAKLLNQEILVFCILLTGGWVKELSGTRAAWLVMGLVATFPMLVINVWTTQLEGLLTFYFLLFLYALSRWLTEKDHDRNGSLALISGIFLGMLVSIKYTGLLLGAASFLGLLWHRAIAKKNPVLSWRGWALGGTGALALWGVWGLRNVVLTGNPIFPYMNQWFNFRPIDPFHMERLISFSRDFPQNIGLSWWNFPWKLTMAPVSIFNFMGPLYLLSIPALLLVHPSKPILKLLCKILIIYLAVCPFISQMPRFHIPILVMGLILLACHWEALDPPIGGQALALAGSLSALLCIPYLCGLSGYYFSYGGIWTGRESTEQCLKRTIDKDNYLCADWIRLHTPLDSRILLTDDPRGFYMERPFLSSMIFEPSIFQTLIRRSPTLEGLQKEVRCLGTDYVWTDDRIGLKYQGWVLPEEKFTTGENGVLDEYLKKCLEPVYSVDHRTIYRVRQLPP